MKKILLITSFAILIGVTLDSCTQTGSTEEAESITKVDKLLAVMEDTTATKPEGNYQDPNQASELALLMRNMYTDSDQMKKAVLSGKLPEDLREKFKKMHSAVATEADMKDASFSAMADVFLKNMDKLYDDKNQIEDYNVLVQSCLACHQSHCPGPISKIKKLTIQQN
jgi:cytochrome c556